MPPVRRRRPQSRRSETEAQIRPRTPVEPAFLASDFSVSLFWTALACCTQGSALCLKCRGSRIILEQQVRQRKTIDHWWTRRARRRQNGINLDDCAVWTGCFHPLRIAWHSFADTSKCRPVPAEFQHLYSWVRLKQSPY